MHCKKCGQWIPKEIWLDNNGQCKDCYTLYVIQLWLDDNMNIKAYIQYILVNTRCLWKPCKNSVLPYGPFEPRFRIVEWILNHLDYC